MQDKIILELTKEEALVVQDGLNLVATQTIQMTKQLILTPSARAYLNRRVVTLMKVFKQLDLPEDIAAMIRQFFEKMEDASHG